MHWKSAFIAVLASSGASLGAGAALAAPDTYIGQIVAVGENFCPDQFMQANGQVLQISSNTALFSLIGCNYGGNCQTTFALPDLRGRTTTHVGTGPGLPTVTQGEYFGAPSHSLTTSEMPAHNHRLVGAVDGGGQYNSPGGHALPTYTDPNIDVYANDPPEPGVQLNAAVVSPTGSGQPFSLYQPTLGVTMCIAVEGLYPPRN